MDKSKTIIDHLLLNKTLTNIAFFNATGAGFHIVNPDKIWIIDGGVQLNFEGSCVSFGWNIEREFFDFQSGEIKGLTKDIELFTLGIRDINSVNNLVSQVIIKIDYKWNFFHDLDSSLEPTEDKFYFPIELTLHFDKGDKLTLSAIKYDIDENTIKNLEYDSVSELLVTLNHESNIKIPEHII
jgi:hypothetical protein